jgi:FtsH-binding integral membrane protein
MAMLGQLRTKLRGDSVGDPQAEKRDNDRDIDQKQTHLHSLRVAQRLRFIWLAASLICVAFLGWALLIGVWTHYRAPFSVLGFAAAVASTSAAAWFIIRARPDLGNDEYDLTVLHTTRLHLAAAEASDPITALRIYRVATVNDLDKYRQAARSNRRASNTLQWFIIVGSVTATSLTSAAAGGGVGLQQFRWIAAIVSAIVSIAAGITGFFKFRERSFNQQQTADAIEKHLRAAELGIREYRGLSEDDVLREFAQSVEELKDEQRKRELQLEQSSERREHQPA